MACKEGITVIIIIIIIINNNSSVHIKISSFYINLRIIIWSKVRVVHSLGEQHLYESRKIFTSVIPVIYLLIIIRFR